MRLPLCVAALAAVSTTPIQSGSARADEDLTEETEFITETVNLLGDCAGLFTFMAETFQTTNQPATARQMKDTANGARMSAAYLLSLEHAAKGKPPKKIGEFLPYAAGREEVTLNRMRALLEQGNTKPIEEEQQRCLAALPMQDEIVQRMRNDMIGR